MKNLDVLFLHPCRLLPDGYDYPLFPMGFLPMASLLSQNGYETEIVNLALEKVLLRRSFNVRRILQHSFEFKIAAIDLNWWVNSYDSIQLAKICKAVNPNCFTVLGGITASFFAKEIIHNFPFVDAVIQGEGEKPLLTLTTSHLHQRPVRNTPNIVVREKGTIYENPLVDLTKTLDSLIFTDLSLLNHWEEHLWLHARPEGYNPSLGLTVFSPWLCIARGCPFNCSFCGGSRESHRMCSKRNEITVRSPEKIIEDITLLENMGIRLIQFSHGPTMTSEKLFTALSTLIRKERLDIDGEMELWTPISTKLLTNLARSFNNLMFTTAIGSGSDDVRRRNRGLLVSNEEYLRFFDKGLNLGIKFNIYFAANLPFETRTTFQNTIKLMRKLIHSKKITSLWVTNYALEPASSLFLHPERYGITPHFYTFMDYYSLLQNERAVQDPVGYHTNYLTKSDSQMLVNEFHTEKQRLLASLNQRIDYSYY